jgi:hypothetical protein
VIALPPMADTATVSLMAVGAADGEVRPTPCRSATAAGVSLAIIIMDTIPDIRRFTPMHPAMSASGLAAAAPAAVPVGRGGNTKAIGRDRSTDHALSSYSTTLKAVPVVVTSVRPAHCLLGRRFRRFMPRAARRGVTMRCAACRPASS